MIRGRCSIFRRYGCRPIDERQLVLNGGIFTTTANRMKQAKGYNYWARNIAIHGSNTTVTGLTHHIVGETDTGHPYGGFLAVSSCANVTLRDCFVTGHKTYTTIGAAGKPVSMGSYDLSANEVVNFTMIGCRMDLATMMIQAQSRQPITVVESQLGNTRQSLVKVGPRLTARMIRRVRRNAAIQRLA